MRWLLQIQLERDLASFTFLNFPSLPLELDISLNVACWSEYTLALFDTLSKKF